jgi:hypothetical protein
MAPKKLISVLVFIIFASGCNNQKVKLKESVSINFRRSYAYYVDRLDLVVSPEDTIPGLDFISPSKDSSILNYLNDLGLVDSISFLIQKVENLAKDTILANLPNKEKIKFYIERDPYFNILIINVEQGKSKDTVKIESTSASPKLLYFDAFKNYGQRLLVYDPWYFVNGDMYTLRVFEIK